MEISDYKIESIALAAKFAHFAQNKNLPALLFGRPDHIALHASDIRDFDRRVKEVDPYSEELIIRETPNRFIVAAHLAGALSVADMGRVRWLEIIEPLPEEAELGRVAGDHIEFVYPDFELALSALKKNSVRYRIDMEPQPRIKVAYNSVGDEFRLTKHPLEAILAEDVANEEAKIIKRAA